MEQRRLLSPTPSNKIFKNLNMHSSYQKLLSLATLLGVFPASAATLTLQGNGLSTLFDPSGTRLVDGSIVQVGYFLGVTPSTSPADYSAADWMSFTPLAGLGSLNSDIDIRTRTQGSFESVYSLGTITLDDGNGDILPPLPTRFGIRIFNTTDPGALAVANYNTTSASFSQWTSSGVITDPPTPDPILSYAQGGSAANPSLFWQDASNPFTTSIAIPEPSTSISSLLGLSFLLGARRRK